MNTYHCIFHRGPQAGTELSIPLTVWPNRTAYYFFHSEKRPDEMAKYFTEWVPFVNSTSPPIDDSMRVQFKFEQWVPKRLDTVAEGGATDPAGKKPA